MEKIKIVIADDTEPILRYVEKIIKDTNEFEIVGTAKDGKELVQIVLSCNPDIVITDEQMPNLTGREAIKLLNENNIKTKYILITGFDDVTMYSCLNELNISKVIKKPILDATHFINQIKNVVNSNREDTFKDEIQEENENNKGNVTKSKSFFRNIFGKK